MGCPVKNDDFGGVFHPLAGKLFSVTKSISRKVGSINSIFYFLHKAAEPFNCLEQDNLA